MPVLIAGDYLWQVMCPLRLLGPHKSVQECMLLWAQYSVSLLLVLELCFYSEQHAPHTLALWARCSSHCSLYILQAPSSRSSSHWLLVQTKSLPSPASLSFPLDCKVHEGRTAMILADTARHSARNIAHSLRAFLKEKRRSVNNSRLLKIIWG